jgi:hypothetical protein
MIKKNWFIVLVITIIVAVIWILTDVVLTKPSVGVDPEITQLITDINPTFDQKIVDKINKVFVPPALDNQTKLIPSPSPSPLSLPSPSPNTATSSAIPPILIPIATNSASGRIEF